MGPSLVWGSPGWLWAASVALGLPVLVHFLSRWSAGRVVYPTARFVRQVVSGTGRWRGVRQWLLMAIRGLALCLVVAAFGRPAYRGEVPVFDPGSGRAVAVVLDRSASMSRVRRGETLFAQAKRQAMATLYGLDPTRDRATVVVLDAHPQALLREPTGNTAWLIDLTERLEPTYHRGDLGAALGLAGDWALRASVDENGVKVRQPIVEVFSDAQGESFADGWAGRLGSRGVGVQLHRVGVEDSNLVVRNASVRPARPVAGQPVTVSAQTVYYSGETSGAAVVVTLEHDGRQQSVNLDLQPGVPQAAAFTVVPEQIGLSLAAVRVERVDYPDPFEADNHTGAWLHTERARRVAMVTGEDVDDPGTAAYYFARALLPDPADPGVAGVELARWLPGEVAGRLRNLPTALGPEAIVLVEAGRIESGGVEALEGYLTNGGAVVWVLDSDEAVRSLMQSGAAGEGRKAISPVVVRGGVLRWASAAEGLAVGTLDNPVLEVLEGAVRGELGRVRFDRVVDVGVAPGSEAWLSFGEDRPAVAVRGVGAGRIAVVAGDLSPGSSDLVKGVLFVPVLHQMVRGLSAGGVGSPSVRPGDSAVLQVGEGVSLDQLAVRGPEGEAVPLERVSSGQGDTVRLGPLEKPGAYAVVSKDTGAVLEGAYVELDPSESDFRVSPQPVSVGTAGDFDGAAVAVDGQTGAKAVELWPYLAALAVVLGGLEAVVAHRGGGGRRGSRAEGLTAERMMAG